MKEHIKGKARFISLQHKELWYKTDSGFSFPIPIDDTLGGIFLAEDKAMFFMRWIRKHYEMLEKAKVDIFPER